MARRAMRRTGMSSRATLRSATARRSRSSALDGRPCPGPGRRLAICQGRPFRAWGCATWWRAATDPGPGREGAGVPLGNQEQEQQRQDDTDAAGGSHTEHLRDAPATSRAVLECCSFGLWCGRQRSVAAHHTRRSRGTRGGPDARCNAARQDGCCWQCTVWRSGSQARCRRIPGPSCRSLLDRAGPGGDFPGRTGRPDRCSPIRSPPRAGSAARAGRVPPRDRAGVPGAVPVPGRSGPARLPG